MPVVVYWDVLWTVNFLLDSVLLACTAFIISKRCSWIRTVLGAALGATYALSPLFSATQFLYQPFLKIVIAFLMVAVAINFSTHIEYLKTTLLFFIISFLAGGTALAFMGLGADIFVFQQANVIIIGITLVAIGFFIKFLYYRMRSMLLRGSCNLDIRIVLNGQTAEATALLDTGNELACPLTGKPIIIVNSAVLEEIIPKELANQDDFLFLQHLSDVWKSRIQILPYSALGKKGMLVAIKPDKIEIKKGSSQTFVEVSALIGLAKHDFCQDKSYKALVSAQLLPAVGGVVG